MKLLCLSTHEESSSISKHKSYLARDLRYDNKQSRFVVGGFPPTRCSKISWFTCNRWIDYMKANGLGTKSNWRRRKTFRTIRSRVVLASTLCEGGEITREKRNWRLINGRRWWAKSFIEATWLLIKGLTYKRNPSGEVSPWNASTTLNYLDGKLFTKFSFFAAVWTNNILAE